MEQSPTKVEQDILIGLGIKEEDVQRYDRERIELVRSGEDTYKRALRKSGTGAPISGEFTIGNLGSITVSRPLYRADEIPDAVMEAVIRDPVLSKRLPEVREWLGALGGEALTNHRDWQTAVIAYDVATEGKIVGNSRLMLKFSEVAHSDILDGVGIAKLMQARRDLKRASAPTPTAQPAPEPPPTV